MKVNKGIIALATAAILQAGLTANAQEIQKNNGSAKKDQQFVTQQAQYGEFEAELGQLAVDTSSNADVVAYGQELVNDHNSSSDQITTVANDDGFTLPSALDKSHQKQLDSLSRMSGTKFDRAFIRDAISSHKQGIKQLQNESKHSQNADLQSYADANTPVEQQHLADAQTLSTELKGTH